MLTVHGFMVKSLTHEEGHGKTISTSSYLLSVSCYVRYRNYDKVSR